MSLPSRDENFNLVILIIDDDINNIRLLRHILTRAGYTVLSGYNTTEARNILNKEQVDILLLDIHMPLETGYSLCQELRGIEKFQLLPIIFITSIDKETGLQYAISYGGDDFIHKPIQRQELLAKVRAFSRIKKLQDALLEQKLNYDRELLMARKVQEQMIPNKQFIWKEKYQVRTFFHPFIQIGGDYVDAWEINDELHVVIADCTGHGPAAALLGAMFKMQLYSIPKTGLSLLERVEVLKEKLLLVLPTNYAITFFYAIIHDNNMQYVNGGHPFPFIYNDGRVEELKGRSTMILDLDIDFKTTSEKVDLPKDSIILLFTDGASEAISTDMKILDTEGLKDIYKQSVEKGGNIIENMLDDLHNFCGGIPPSDDIAFITIQVIS
ncbi:MAG: fused response regulator/phosphatase [Leptospiraceae bacterium]|nr:fused response regulator/phosphatase [Leptospiraceae bacterium]MCP5495045.1 fused response regulator/phosphatase [Leptospiraceae bacterium]